MAETPRPDLPEKEKPAVNSDPAPKEKLSPDKPAAPSPDKPAEPPAVGGKDRPAHDQQPHIVGIDFPSGKKIKLEETVKPQEPPGKTAPAAKEPGKDKKPVDRPKAAAKPDKPKNTAPRRGRPPKGEQSAPMKPPEENKDEPLPTVPKTLRVDAPRSGEEEKIQYINLAELHPFKDHPFAVRDDNEMKALVESVKDKGVHSPALVRPRPDGGYELIAGHRRQRASEVAGFKDMPCIVRNMTDDEAILAMTDDNLRQRSEILPSERAVSLKMQVEAIKHQGIKAAEKDGQPADVGKRSTEVVGARNNMGGKQVQRYVRLTELNPELLKAVDEKKLKFMPAVELSYIGKRNQGYIAVAIESEQIYPSIDQAKKMRELDQKKLLNNDSIDGILSNETKEVVKVTLSGEELTKYFGQDKTPREMKDQILKLLDDWKEKQPVIEQPQKKADLEK